jgi:predicted dinucleotide-binding enzyme
MDARERADSINPATAKRSEPTPRPGQPETARAIAAALRTFREMEWRSDRRFRAKALNAANPFAPDGKGGFKKTISAEQFSGQLLAALLPAGGRLVKAFGTLTAESLASGANRSPERAVLFYATDFTEAGRVVETLITASGFSPLRVGGIDQSIRIEVGGDLHEFGKLNKLVSVKRAEALI